MDELLITVLSECAICIKFSRTLKNALYGFYIVFLFLPFTLLFLLIHSAAMRAARPVHRSLAFSPRDALFMKRSSLKVIRISVRPVDGNDVKKSQ